MIHEYSGVCRICEKRKTCKCEYHYPDCLELKDPYWHLLDGTKRLMTLKDAEELTEHLRISDRFFVVDGKREKK